MADRKLSVTITGDPSGGQRALQTLGGEATTTAGTTEAAGKRIGAGFSTVFGQLNQSGVLGPLSEQIHMATEAFDTLASHGKSVSSTLMAGGGAALAAGGGLSAIASKDVAAGAQLKSAIETTGAAYSDFGEDIEKAVKHQENFGTTADTTKDALRILTTATGDPTKALDLMSVAADLAASKHESLSDAATQLNAVLGGKGAKMLTQYGIVMKTNADGTKDVQGALDQLSAKVAGQASSSVEGFGGKMSVVKAKVEDVAAALGAKYGPALMAVGAITTTAGAAINAGSAILSKFKIGQEAAAGASALLTTATEGEAVAMDAAAVSEGIALGPILLIIAAVALLGIGIYELVTHWDTVWSAIQTAVSVAWDTISGIISGAIGWLGANWDLVLGILTGPFGLAADYIYRNWDDIIGFITGLPGAIANAASGMWDGIVDAFKGAINGIIGVWDNFSFPSLTVGGIDTPFGTTPGFTFGGWSLPNIPYLAQGGVTTGPMLAMLGDNPSGHEAIVPLEKAGAMGFGGGAAVPSAAPIHLTINAGMGTDVQALGTVVLRAVEAALKIGGRPGPHTVNVLRSAIGLTP